MLDFQKLLFKFFVFLYYIYKRNGRQNEDNECDLGCLNRLIQNGIYQKKEAEEIKRYALKIIGGFNENKKEEIKVRNIDFQKILFKFFIYSYYIYK